MSDVYIVGADMIKFGKFPDRSVESLGAESALGALDDAGVTINDIQALYAGNLMQAMAMVGQRIQQEIGQTGIPVINTSNACATGATARGSFSRHAIATRIRPTSSTAWIRSSLPPRAFRWAIATSARSGPWHGKPGSRCTPSATAPASASSASGRSGSSCPATWSRTRGP